jgi:beta-aspartyl-dipeptidase (metallo-type)
MARKVGSSVSSLLLKNAQVYAPESLGVQDVLVAAGKIICIGKELSGLPVDEEKMQVIDCDGALLTPGFIDAHVHMLGGGGGAGYGSRAPELTATEAFMAGTTTVIGCLGVDTVTRNVMALVAKARSLRERYLNVYCVDGGLDLPIHTLTGSLREDMYLIPEIIGVGEPAISDKRSTQPSLDDLRKLVADVHVAGRLAGKMGFVQFHLGDSPSGIKPLLDILPDVLIKHIVPLHFNRNPQVLSEAPEWAKNGGYIDLTVPLYPPAYKLGKSVPDSIELLKSQGVDRKLLTVSSDGNGVSTLFGKDYIHRFPLNILYNDVKIMYERGMELGEAVSYVTSNVADAYGLASKGRIEAGKDADLVVMERDGLKIRTVVSAGMVVVDKGTRMPPTYGIDV